MQPAIGLFGFIAATIGFAANLLASGEASEPPPTPLRVGTFDSRAVAVACARSALFQDELKRLRQQYDRAKAAGNDSEVKRLEAEGKAGQDRLHQQVFSTASVQDIVARIKDQLPGIAKQAGVDLLVSKWEAAYIAPEAKTIDVTDLIVKPFQPDAKTRQIVAQLRKQAPVPLGKLKMDTKE